MALALQILADQTLRERGEGESTLTNPNLFVRRRFRKLYEDYKPKYSYWKLALIVRKLSLAAVAILLSKSPNLQVSVTARVDGGVWLAVD